MPSISDRLKAAAKSASDNATKLKKAAEKALKVSKKNSEISTQENKRKELLNKGSLSQ